jgi:hypothetical protein
MKYTANYNLKKPDYTDLADIADINTNMDTIDTKLKENADNLTSHTNTNASTLAKGHVQLSDSVSSTSISLAATANAVKKAYDKAKEAFQSASDGKTGIASVIGSPATSGDTFSMMFLSLSNNCSLYFLSINSNFMFLKSIYKKVSVNVFMFSALSISTSDIIYLPSVRFGIVALKRLGGK